jgi:hypothetical protein
VASRRVCVDSRRIGSQSVNHGTGSRVMQVFPSGVPPGPTPLPMTPPTGSVCGSLKSHSPAWHVRAQTPPLSSSYNFWWNLSPSSFVGQNSMHAWHAEDKLLNVVNSGLPYLTYCGVGPGTCSMLRKEKPSACCTGRCPRDAVAAMSEAVSARWMERQGMVGN